MRIRNFSDTFLTTSRKLRFFVTVLAGRSQCDLAKTSMAIALAVCTLFVVAATYEVALCHGYPKWSKADCGNPSFYP